MPRFFIDTSDEHIFVKDKVGTECKDISAAKTLAVDALPDMARDELPDGDYRTFLAIVRNEQDRTLLKASLSLAVVWFGDQKNGDQVLY